MIFKIILLPLTLIKMVVGLIFSIIKFFSLSIIGIGKFVVSRVFGTIFGALIGFFLGMGSLKKRTSQKIQKTNNS